MTINLHDITGQESGIILVETDDGRHMNVVANWGAKDGLPYLFEPMLEPFSFVFLQPEDVHVETERIHSGALNDEIAHDGLEDWNPLDDDLDSDEPCDVYPLSNGTVVAIGVQDEYPAVALYTIYASDEDYRNKEPLTEGLHYDFEDDSDYKDGVEAIIKEAC